MTSRLNFNNSKILTMGRIKKKKMSKVVSGLFEVQNALKLSLPLTSTAKTHPMCVGSVWQRETAAAAAAASLLPCICGAPSESREPSDIIPSQTLEADRDLAQT